MTALRVEQALVTAVEPFAEEPSARQSVWVARPFLGVTSGEFRLLRSVMHPRIRLLPRAVVALMFLVPAAADAGVPKKKATAAKSTKKAAKPKGKAPSAKPSPKAKAEPVGPGPLQPLDNSNRPVAKVNPTPDVKLTSKVKKCGPAKVLEVLEQATEAKPKVNVDCHLTLGNANVVVTKEIRIDGARGSGVTIDCNGATLAPTIYGRSILVRSVRDKDGNWSRPAHVSIRECRVKKQVLVGVNMNKTQTTASSRQADHTERMQAIAPTRIRFEKMFFDVDEKPSFYVGVGATRITLKKSEIHGHTRAPAIYLDAESGWNTIVGNKIHKTSQANTPGAKREQLAIDGSAHNLIMANHFSGLNHGGIHIYRNSGESGTIRHQKPQHNHIVNNYFYYNKYDGDEQAIFIASRMGSREDHNDADAGYPYGSSVSNMDHAKYNVVAENQVRKRKVADVFLMHDAPNYFYSNKTVGSRTIHPTGCFYKNDGAPNWAKHGDVVPVGYGADKKSMRCDDHELVEVATHSGKKKKKTWKKAPRRAQAMHRRKIRPKQ